MNEKLGLNVSCPWSNSIELEPSTLKKVVCSILYSLLGLDAVKKERDVIIEHTFEQAGNYRQIRYEEEEN